MTTSSETKKKIEKEDNKKEEVKVEAGKSKKDEIIKAIGQMNVLELSDLIKRDRVGLKQEI